MLFFSSSIIFFFFNDTATTEIYTLSLHDALPISAHSPRSSCSNGTGSWNGSGAAVEGRAATRSASSPAARAMRRSSAGRSEEHTSELQSRLHLVCRLLLEKKKNEYCIHADS